MWNRIQIFSSVRCRICSRYAQIVDQGELKSLRSLRLLHLIVVFDYEQSSFQILIAYKYHNDYNIMTFFRIFHDSIKKNL